MPHKLELQKDGNRLTIRTDNVMDALFDISIGRPLYYFPKNRVNNKLGGITALDFLQRKGIITISFGDYNLPRDKQGKFKKRGLIDAKT